MMDVNRDIPSVESHRDSAPVACSPIGDKRTPCGGLRNRTRASPHIRLSGHEGFDAAQTVYGTAAAVRLPSVAGIGVADGS